MNQTAVPDLFGFAEVNREREKYPMNHYSLAVAAAVLVVTLLMVISYFGVEDQHVLNCQSVIREVAGPPPIKFGKTTIFNGKREKVIQLSFSAATTSGALNEGRIECSYRAIAQSANSVEYAENPSYATLNGKPFSKTVVDRIYPASSHQ